MAPIDWSSEYSVGVEELDGQHRRWIEIMNELETALDSDLASQATSKALQAMIEYTQEHFSREEELMRRTEFPEFESHKALHDGFVAQCQSLHCALKRANSATAKILFGQARRWFMEHIQVVDKQYSQHLNERGIA